jgi:hypothetical protein
MNIQALGAESVELGDLTRMQAGNDLAWEKGDRLEYLPSLGGHPLTARKMHLLFARFFSGMTAGVFLLGTQQLFLTK